MNIVSFKLKNETQLFPLKKRTTVIYRLKTVCEISPEDKMAL